MVEPDAATFRTELAELESRLDCAAWSRRVPPTVVPHALPRLLTSSSLRTHTLAS